MKVLFVSSGNHKTGVNPIIRNQGESLRSQHVIVEYFGIKGKGLKGYFKNILPLVRKVKNNEYDIIHAHYATSAYLTTIALRRRIVVSLMGSDVQGGYFSRLVLILFIRFFWSRTIVKSNSMQKKLKSNKLIILPNGVDLRAFSKSSRKKALKTTKLEKGKKHIVFLADPKRREKNFKLAQDAVNLLDNDEVTMKLHAIYGKPFDEIIPILFTADVLLLTSLWEGSPNVIKEAMAANLPIVSTNVGDVSEIINGTKGCYLADYDPADVAQKLNLASEFNNRTDGYERISKFYNSANIASRLITIYQSLI